MSAPQLATEEELHAFVDGALDDARRDEVARLLRDDPVLAARVAGWTRDRDCLVAAVAGIAGQPIPADWIRRIEAGTARPAPAAFNRRYAMAAGVALALAGGAAVVWRRPRGLLADAQDARDGRAGGADPMPAPMLADADARDARLRMTLGLPIRAPDLRRFGFRLARLDLFARAAQLRYDDARQRDLTIYVRPSDGNVRFDLLRHGATRICVWQDDVVAAVIIAPMSAGEMMRVASSAYGDLNL